MIAADATVAESKRRLRPEMRERRLAIPANVHAEASRAAAWSALAGLPWRERPEVALFWPLADEIDTLPLLHAMHWLGARPLLPRMQGRGRPLTFHAWSPDAPLVAGPFKVQEPAPDRPPVLPRIVLAPLLAFDGQGRRLGYGAAFYDMTFAALADTAPLRVGYCFACQEIPAVPADASDVPLQLVVTEAGCRTIT